MAYQTKKLTCGECMNAFNFTSEEQEINALKGLTRAPYRCPECRASRDAVQARRAATPVVPSRRRY